MTIKGSLHGSIATVKAFSRFLSAQCVSSIRQITRPVCVSVSQRVSQSVKKVGHVTPS